MKLKPNDIVNQYRYNKLTGTCTVIRITPAGTAICKEGARFKYEYDSDGAISPLKPDGFNYSIKTI